MNKAELARAIDLLPAFWPQGGKNNDWNHKGRMRCFNARFCPDKIQKLTHKIIKGWEDSPFNSSVEWFDTSRIVWHMQRRLKSRTLAFDLRSWSWQRWPKSRLPIIVVLHRRCILWNGTHRWTLCYLTGRRLRTRIIDLDEYIKWRGEQRRKTNEAKRRSKKRRVKILRKHRRR